MEWGNASRSEWVVPRDGGVCPQGPVPWGRGCHPSRPHSPPHPLPPFPMGHHRPGPTGSRKRNLSATPEECLLQPLTLPGHDSKSIFLLRTYPD